MAQRVPAVSNLLDKPVGYENLETGDNHNRPRGTVMVLSVIISVFAGLVVGCASVAIWAARRIGHETARQFDRGFAHGCWLADLTTVRGLEPERRTRRIPNVPGLRWEAADAR